uniref:Uncharacterized protein n=1 Tax=Arundo donax TaxID=35708 RepID=A0A0A9F4D6_ARUDO
MCKLYTQRYGCFHSLRSGCGSLLQQLLHLGDIIGHRLLLGFPFNSLPSIPFGSVFHVENVRPPYIFTML